jgi:ATP-dependent Lhr-like helicase
MITAPPSSHEQLALPDPQAQRAAGAALAALVRTGRLATIVVETLDGTPALAAASDEDLRDTVDALADAGFTRTPKGLRLR